MTGALRQSQAGLTLVELMIALLLGSILVAGAIGLFLSSQQTQTTRKKLDGVAEDLRDFSNFIVRDIRLAGHQTPDCVLSRPGLAWDSVKKLLVIRYCKPNGRHTDTVEYRFDSDGTVQYRNAAEGETTQPLINGITLDAIWFGKATSAGLVYQKTVVRPFAQLHLVQLIVTASDVRRAGPDPLAPTIDFTVAIRNNAARVVSSGE